MVTIEIITKYQNHTIHVSAEAKTEDEAKKLAEAKIEEAKRKIDEMQNECKHELELVSYNSWFRSYKYKCKKCGKIIYEGENIFSDKFFDAWRKGLTTIPKHPPLP